MFAANIGADELSEAAKILKIAVQNISKSILIAEYDAATALINSLLQNACH